MSTITFTLYNILHDTNTFYSPDNHIQSCQRCNITETSIRDLIQVWCSISYQTAETFEYFKNGCPLNITNFYTPATSPFNSGTATSRLAFVRHHLHSYVSGKDLLDTKTKLHRDEPPPDRFAFMVWYSADAKYPGTTHSSLAFSAHFCS